jgi:hypothetical protein
MADYQNRVSQSFSERMRMNRFRRKREQTSFAEEFRIVPKWLLVGVGVLYVLALAIGVYVNLTKGYVGADGAFHHTIWPWEYSEKPALACLMVCGVITAVAIPLSGYLFLLGYVSRDAKRRGMNSGLWLLLILVLSPAYLAIGFLLYFFLREPLTYPCPQCGATVGPRFNFCPNCKNNLHPACPQCKQEVAETDKFCPNCAFQLAPSAREEAVAR